MTESVLSMFSKFVFLLFFLLPFSDQRSTPESDHYVAAVLEYNPSRTVDENLQNYVKYIAEAAQQDADIVAFPELTLGGTPVPVPINGILRQHPVPADQKDLYHKVLVEISAAAKQHQIYVVINVQEEMDCQNNDTGEYCPEAKVYYFNTNVVFDRRGAVIDRYRKINLYGELSRTPALRPDLGIFETDFGVTFGHFICFDLMFQVPSIQVVEKHNITDVVFTTMWFSEIPYLTAVQIQEAYAYALDINFIASGANNVKFGSAGSGIYSGKKGALISIMPGVPTSKLLVSQVPKIPGKITSYPGPIYDKPEDQDELLLKTDPSLPEHVSHLLTDGSQEFTLVDKEVTCKFRVKLNHGNGITPSHKYRAFVFDGSNKYVNKEIGASLCIVVACEDDSVNTCAHRFNKHQDDVEIQELDIEMSSHKLQYNDTLKCDDVVYYPVSLRINKFPLDPSNFTFSQSPLKGKSQNIESKNEEDARKEIVNFRLSKPQNDLLSFGVWGRIFIKDVDHTENVPSLLDVSNVLVDNVFLNCV